MEHRTALDPFESEADRPGEPGVVILDGGLATTLESKGYELNDPLWSARLLIEAPDAIREVHREFLEAGADVIATVTYQASIPGFAGRGIDRDEALALMRRAVDLAVGARDRFWAVREHRAGRRRPLVAASVGPYGAFLADGSEYTGEYGLGEPELYAFHRDRWHLFADGAADLLACETIPSRTEVAVLLRLLGETPGRPAWISLSCRDEGHLADGTPLGEVARLCDTTADLVAVGVNCIRPESAEPLLSELRRHTAKPLLVYPNAGEEYDAVSKRWASPPSDLDWSLAGARWVRAGARGVGGCCRVGPEQIRALRTALVG
jgi:homocysteine S-methyltransferase